MHHRCVHGNVGIVVLVDECLRWGTVQERHVLANRVTRGHIILNWDELLSVLDAQDFQHLTVQLGQVIYLRCTLCQLNSRLVLHDPLRHRCAVGIGHGDNLNHVVVGALGAAVGTGWLVLVLIWGVVTNNLSQKLELLLHGRVNPGLNSAHGLQCALQQRQSRPNGCIAGHIRDFHVADRAQTAGFVCNLVQQRQKCLAWLFVRQGHDVVTHGTACHVYISELARCNRGIVALDTQTFGFQAAGEVSQRSCVNKLTNQAGSSAGIAANQVNQAKSVRTEAGNVGVLDKMLATKLFLVVFFPVAANSQHFVGAALDGNYIGKRNPVIIFVTGHVVVNMNLHQLIPVVVRDAIALLFSLFLLYIGRNVDGIAQIHVPVEARHLQFADIVLSLAHDVGHTL